MTRSALVSLLFLGVVSFSGPRFFAQQTTPATSSSDRPIKVVIVKGFYGNYRYRLATAQQSRYFAGFTQMTLTLGTTSQAPVRPGAETLRGRSEFEAITLDRGVTHDNTFAQWAKQTPDHQQLRDLTLDVFNEAGRRSATHKLTGCVVSEYQALPNLALPNLDGGANDVTIEHIQLRCREVK